MNSTESDYNNIINNFASPDFILCLSFLYSFPSIFRNDYFLLAFFFQIMFLNFI